MHQSNESGNSLSLIMARAFAVLHTPQEFLLAVKMIPFEAWVNRVIRIAFIFVCLNAFYRIYLKGDIRKNNYFELITIIQMFLLLFLFTVGITLSGITYADKYMALTFPFFLLIFALFKEFSPVKRSFLYGGLITYFMLLLIINYWHPVKIYDYKSLINYVEKIEKPGEPILLYRSALSLPFSYYYKGVNAIIPLPHPVRFDTSYLINIKDTIQLKESILRQASVSKSYLFISDLTPYESTLNMNREMVDGYFRNNFDISIDTLYYGWSKKYPLRIWRLVQR